MRRSILIRCEGNSTFPTKPLCIIKFVSMTIELENEVRHTRYIHGDAPRTSRAVLSRMENVRTFTSLQCFFKFQVLENYCTTSETQFSAMLTK